MQYNKGQRSKNEEKDNRSPSGHTLDSQLLLLCVCSICSSKGKTIPIIAMTANAFSEDVQHCLEAGMDAHIAKPIDITVLEKTLRGFVSGGR